MKIKINEFLIYHKKFEDESNRSVDWLIKSWSMQDEDRDISLLFYKKHKRLSMENLEKAIELL